ncbi:MAG: tRNA preQ1(34) S-adenosylmethionine ribosyltransferase-isomerase QueA [bacterium]
MKVEDFYYHLPPERIAQKPLPERSASRLLVLDRRSGKSEEVTFRELSRCLAANDLLVLNHTRVQPLRLAGKKSTGGKMEITLVRRLDEQTFEGMIKGKNPAAGMAIELSPGAQARVLGRSASEVRVSAQEGAPLWNIKIEGERPEELLRREGLPPLPPYIRRGPEDDPDVDRQRYQTVYAREGEAAAAPTAGFHFTEKMLNELAGQGVGIAYLRLDVSFGTFSPVKAERVEDHRMHPEYFELPEDTARRIEKTKSEGGRVIAVGTTVVRVLEHCALENGSLSPGRGSTSIFIYPGFRFRVVDAMITNFHMPGSTLIMLVSAFAGRERILEAYQYALDAGFRFLSYGDAMLIL